MTNSNFRVGNAPVSFGIFEPAFGETKQLPYPKVLEMIAAAGYEGTELGPYGYLPTDPRLLEAALKKEKLSLASSFVPLRLADPAARDQAAKEVLTVARLLATQEVQEVILADAGDEKRIALAGNDPPGWDDKQWEEVARTFEHLANLLEKEFAMRIVVHHHVGTYLETPSEIEHLLKITDPQNVGLLLDTGHFVYGGGDCLSFLERYSERINYLHFKDIDKNKLAFVRKEKMDMHRAWRQNVFVPLSKGCVDFLGIVKQLKKTTYSGWIIVEQDTIADEQGRLNPDPFESAKTSRQYLTKLGL
ncbi:MAG: TIM barrel protein [Pseudomonadota bacterium]